MASPIATTSYDFHGRLLRDTFGGNISDPDAFLLFTLFHSYQVELAGPVLTDLPNLGKGTHIAALTQRGCSEALASLWAGTADERANYTYWYYRWNGQWGSYGHAEALTQQEAVRLQELIGRLETHPFVKRILPED